MKKLLTILIIYIFFISCKEKEVMYKYEIGTIVHLDNEIAVVQIHEEYENGIYYRVKLLHCKSQDEYSCSFDVKESELTK